MATLTSQSLAKIVKLRPKPKKVAPKWPDSEKSVGNFLRYLKKDQCWEAVNEVSEVFEELSKLIQQHLNNFCERPNVAVTWSVYMIGRTKQTANPTIIFASKDKKSRQAIKKAVEESGILQNEQYTAFRIGDSNRPPDCEKDIVPLASKTLEPSSNMPSTLSRESPVGNLITFYDPELNTTTYARSTVGSVFRVGDRFFMSTVAHVLPSASNASAFEEADDEEDFEYELDGEDDSEDESGPLLDEQNDSYAIHCDPDVDGCEQTALLDHPDQFAHAETRPPLNISTAALAHLSEKSLNPKHPSLDYCLIDIDPTTFQHLSDISTLPDSQETTLLRPHDFARIGNTDRNIFCYTGTSGVLSGIISATASFTLSPHKGACQEHWRIRVNGQLNRGDCGSVVIDAETGSIYGYVVAGIPQSGIAYIVPGYQILEDIKEYFDPSAELATDHLVTGHTGLSANFLQSGAGLSRAHNSTYTTLNCDSDMDQDERQRTSSWIFEHSTYRSWLNSSTGLLWIKGNPGSGKSMVMRNIVRHITSRNDERMQDVVACFYFHSQGNHLKDSTLEIFRSLLQQLLKHPLFLPDESTLADPGYWVEVQSPGWGGNLQLTYQQRGLEQTLGSILMELGRQRRVFIFADALDEIGEVPAKELLETFRRWLRDATTAHARLQICLSCRHFPDISPDDDLQINAEEHNGVDIRTFVENNLHGLQEFEKSILVRNIVSRSNGMFLWAKLVTDQAVSLRKEGLPLQNIVDKLRKTPPELQRLYTQILGSEGSSHHSPEALKLLQWICFAQQALTPREVHDALLIEAAKPQQTLVDPQQNYGTLQDLTDIVRCLRALSKGLIEVKDAGDGPRVQLIHHSVHDFLLKHHGFQYLDSSFAAVSASDLAGKSHSKLARACLRYLSLGYSGWNINNALENFDDTGYSLWKYAATYWTDHLVLAESMGEPQGDLVDWFAQPQGNRALSAWYQATRMLGYNAGSHRYGTQYRRNQREKREVGRNMSEQGPSDDQWWTSLEDRRHHLERERRSRGQEERSPYATTAADNFDNEFMVAQLEDRLCPHLLADCNWPPCEMTLGSVAAALGVRSIIRSIIASNDGSLHEPDKLGHTPLFYACQWGQTEVVQLLLHAETVDASRHLRGQNGDAFFSSSSTTEAAEDGWIAGSTPAPDLWCLGHVFLEMVQALKIAATDTTVPAERTTLLRAIEMENEAGRRRRQGELFLARLGDCDELHCPYQLPILSVPPERSSIRYPEAQARIRRNNDAGDNKSTASTQKASHHNEGITRRLPEVFDGAVESATNSSRLENHITAGPIRTVGDVEQGMKYEDHDGEGSSVINEGSSS